VELQLHRERRKKERALLLLRAKSRGLKVRELLLREDAELDALRPLDSWRVTFRRRAAGLRLRQQEAPPRVERQLREAGGEGLISQRRHVARKRPQEDTPAHGQKAQLGLPRPRELAQDARVALGQALHGPGPVPRDDCFRLRRRTAHCALAAGGGAEAAEVGADDVHDVNHRTIAQPPVPKKQRSTVHDDTVRAGCVRVPRANPRAVRFEAVASLQNASTSRKHATREHVAQGVIEAYW